MSENVSLTTSGLADSQHGSQLIQRYQQSLSGVFGTPQAVLVRGSGARVWDADGREYLDLLGGIAVNALGHAHPLITAVISSQQATLGHISNLFTSPTQIALAEKLIAVAGAPEGSSVFFANSGSEANEAALKAVLRHRQNTGKQRILALEGSFHGRTTGALSLTHKPAYREPFGPLVPGVEFLAPNDLDALERAFENHDVAGMFLEPIQGENGVRGLDDAYLLRVRELTRSSGALMVLDEVQTGVGRTGRWFRHQAVQGLLPDLMTLAKGLGSGFPIGAMISFGAAASELMTAGQHGTTFGGNPPATAAALATLHVIEADGVLENVVAVGDRLAAALHELPQVKRVRQYGLHIGADLQPEVCGTAAPATELVPLARERHGLILNATDELTVRLAPPLNLSPEEADEAIGRLTAALKDLPA